MNYIKYFTILLIPLFFGCKQQEVDIFKKVLDHAGIGVDSLYNSYNGVNAMWDDKYKYYLSDTLESDIIIFVIPIVSEVYDANAYDLDNHIILTNKSGELLYHLYEPSTWSSDAIRLTNIKIKDTYYLSDSVIAFSLASKTSAGGWVLGDEEELSIYSIDNNIVSKVLNKLPIYMYNGEPIGQPGDKPFYRKLTREIRILPTLTNGLYDIAVENAVEKTDDWNDSDDVEDNSIQILKFNLSSNEYEFEIN